MSFTESLQCPPVTYELTKHKYLPHSLPKRKQKDSKGRKLIHKDKEQKTNWLIKRKKVKAEVQSSNKTEKMKGGKLLSY